MQYDSYREKVKRVADVLGKLYARRFLILIALVVLVALSLGVTMTRGLLLTEKKSSSEVVYGEKLPYSASFWMTKAHYEYRKQGEDVWSEQHPVLPGEYQVRAWGETVLGKPNYTQPHDFTMIPREITLLVEETVVEYGQTPRVGVSDPIEGDMVEGWALLDYQGSTKALATPDASSLRITDEKGNDRTFCYTVRGVEESLVELLPRPMTIKVQDARKVYDGMPLFCQDHEIIQGSLVEGDELEVLFSATQVDVGSTSNKPEISFHNQKGQDVTELYAVTVQSGQLTVEARSLLVQAGSGTYVYTGETLDCRSFTLSPDTPLVEGHSLVLLEATTGLDCGTQKNYQSFAVRNSHGGEESHNYFIRVEVGTLTITPRQVEVITHSATFTYDGTPHSHPEFTVEGISYGSSGSVVPRKIGVECRAVDPTNRQDVGTSENRFTVRFYRDGEDVSFNYQITGYTYGELTVVPRDLRVTLPDQTKVYDGVPLYADGEAPTLGGMGLVSGHELFFEVQGEVLFGEAASRYVEGTAVVKDANGTRVTDNYAITFEDGTLTVTPRPLVIVAEEVSKVYDGTPLRAEEGTFSLQGTLLDKHRLDVVMAGETLVQVGRTSLTVDLSSTRILHKETGEDVTRYYDITCRESFMEVIPRPITVRTSSGEWIYDGEVHRADSEFTLIAGSLVLGHTLQRAAEGTAIRQVGSVENRVKVLVMGEEGEVTQNYSITYEYGTLTVTDASLIGQLYPTANGRLYLRMTSYGSYNGGGWESALPYADTLSGGYDPNILPSIYPKGLGLLEKQTLRFRRMRLGMLPYYTDRSGNSPVVGSDTNYATAPLGEDYEVVYYPVKDSLTLLQSFYQTPPSLREEMSGELAARERAYRSFVYDQYLELDGETRAFMERIIREQGFDPASPTILRDVAVYIRCVARYDTNYDPALDREPNQAVAFLRDYREGVCVHYATAATLLYRALGIPARYTTGFMLDVKGGQWNDIRSPGHAWVEVYVDGLGWLCVEVTGSAAAPRPSGDPTKPELVLIPAFAQKTYDGTPLYAKDRLVITPQLEELLAKGYTYKVSVLGSQQAVGDGVSRIHQFFLFDEDGTDVTNRFSYDVKEGLIRVTNTVMEVMLYPVVKTYDGGPARWEEGDYLILSLPDGLPDGAQLTLRVTLPADRRGYITLAQLNLLSDAQTVYQVMLNGADVTWRYSVVFTLPEGMEEVPVLTVNPRVLELVAASETRIYDGQPLSNPHIYISKGSLVTGHSLVAYAQGEQREVGSCKNVIGSVDIRDEEGRDVTDLYVVNSLSGTLTLLEPEAPLTEGA